MSPPGGDSELAGLVIDASVLIDYAQSDVSVLGLLSRHVTPLHIPSPVLDEAYSLSAKDARHLGIDVLEPTLTQVLDAKARVGANSFPDCLCFVVAHDAGWSVLTNDKRLRKACADDGIPCVWGLEAMALLVKQEHLSAVRAMAVAKMIACVNPFIADRILRDFRAKLGLK